MDSNQQFFYDHAGYSYDPKTETPDEGRHRCAVALADAEQRWLASGALFIVDPDEDNGPDSVGMLIVGPDGTVLASLWAIEGADDNYTRVVRAELALEAFPR